MSNSSDTSNVVPFDTVKHRAGPDDPFYEQCARLAKEYECTTISTIIARYEEDRDGVRFHSIQFEFDTQCQPAMPPSAELMKKTVEAFTSLFARLAEEYDPDIPDGHGTMRWDLLNDRLENEHTTLIEMRSPKR